MEILSYLKDINIHFLGISLRNEEPNNDLIYFYNKILKPTIVSYFLLILLLQC